MENHHTKAEDVNITLENTLLLVPVLCNSDRCLRICTGCSSLIFFTSTLCSLLGLISETDTPLNLRPLPIYRGCSVRDDSRGGKDVFALSSFPAMYVINEIKIYSIYPDICTQKCHYLTILGYSQVFLTLEIHLCAVFVKFIK